MSSAAARASPPSAPPVLRPPSQPLVPVTESENSACQFFPAPRSVYGILYFRIDPVLLAAFRVDIDINRGFSTDTVFPTAVQGEMLPKRLVERARLPVDVRFKITRVRFSAYHLLVIPQRT